MLTKVSYNVVIERFKAFADGHYLIRRFSHGQIDVTDITMDNEYSWMHIVPVSMTPADGSISYEFDVIFADLPRDKETPTEYQRESLSDCIRLAEDLISEIKNGGVIFGDDVTLDSGTTIEPFIEEYTHTLTGVNCKLSMTFANNWSACDIPADWAIGGSGSGGTGGGGGASIILRTNGTDNAIQTILDVTAGANMTITDLGDGRVQFDATGDIGTNWGTIGGLLTNQTDLQDALDLKVDITSLAAVATSGDYNDLINLPTIPTLTSELTNDSGFITSGDIPPIPTLTSELTNDSGFITIGDVPTQVQSNWTQSDNGQVDYIKNKPSLATVATSGSYTDLSNQPSIPANLDDLTDVNATSPTNAQVLTFNTATGKWIASTPAGGGSGTVTSVGLTMPTAFSVASSPVTTSGTIAVTGAGSTSQYVRGDGTLATFPTIPAAQIQSDWTQASISALDYIKNKPTIPAAQVNSDWNAVSGVAQILNKPTINAGTVTSVGTAGLISGGTITSSGTITTSMNTSKLVGRYTAGTGVMQEISVGSGLTLTGAGVLNNTATPTPTGYYGGWQDTSTQTAAVDNTGYAMIFRVVDFENQVRVVTDGANLTRITFDNTGIYNLNFSVQIQNTDNVEHDVSIWIRKNGVDVLGSTGYVTVPKRRSTGAGLEGHTIAGWNYMIEPLAGDYYQLMWSTTNHTNVTLHFYAAGSPPPSTSSVLAIVTQQSGIMAGTGMTALNTLTGAVQTIATGTSGTNFNVSSAGTTHTFNLPTASATNRGALSSADFTTFNAKESALTFSTPLNRSTNTISIPAASASVNGYLTSTDWSTFNGQASYSAYTMKANNTASSAIPASFNFKDLGEQTFTQTITWSTAAPTGTTNLKYRWFQVGNVVHFSFYFTYGTAATNSNVQFDHPSDMPIPVTFGGLGTTANTYLFRYLATLGATQTVNPPLGWYGGLRKQSPTVSYNWFFSSGTASSVLFIQLNGTYFTA